MLQDISSAFHSKNVNMERRIRETRRGMDHFCWLEGMAERVNIGHGTTRVTLPLIVEPTLDRAYPALETSTLTLSRFARCSLGIQTAPTPLDCMFKPETAAASSSTLSMTWPSAKITSNSSIQNGRRNRFELTSCENGTVKILPCDQGKKESPTVKNASPPLELEVPKWELYFKTLQQREDTGVLLKKENTSLLLDNIHYLISDDPSKSVDASGRK